jgi:hypothetical protein
MKDYKLKQRNLRASHTLGWSLSLSSFFFQKKTWPAVTVSRNERRAISSKRRDTIDQISGMSGDSGGASSRRKLLERYEQSPAGRACNESPMNSS